ncbi:diguanylate cyclase [Oryzobacter terrae]|uniref:sensor domain-containing diguanylate cyclase n=1 Tax=Oryzobacter terrae TaxID=1620385 RepID=UPI00366E70D1
MLFAAAIALGRSTALPETGLALMWPAAGIGVLWTLRARSSREVGTALGLIGLVATVGNAVTGFAAGPAVLLGASNVAACLVARRLMGGPVGTTPAHEVRSLGQFYRLLAAGAVSTAVSAAIGMAGIGLAGVDVTWSASAGWWLRNMTGIVVIAAPALTLVGRRLLLTRPLVLEAAVLYLLTILTVVAVFAPGNTLPLAFVPLGFVVWAGLRLPLPLAAAEGGLIAVGALVMLRTTGGGPFGAIGDLQVASLVLQGFMMLAVTLALVLATVHAELAETVDGLAAARRRAEEAAADLDVLIADAPYGVVVVGVDGRIRRTNRAMAGMFECGMDDITGAEAVAFSTRPEQEVHDYLSRAVAAGGRPVTTDWATHSLTGRPLHLALSSRLLAGRSGAAEILVNVVDVSERRREREHLSQLAATDALTGLPNRRRFEEVLARHGERCADTGWHGALLLLDLDHFKAVNDTLGHAAGDRLLRSVAAVLRDVLRASDTVARLGGDEFAVLLPDADDAAAAVVAATVVERVREHCAALEGAHRQVTTSVGVVSFTAAADRGRDALAVADDLMYDAKGAGRDGWALLGADGTHRGSAATAVAARTPTARSSVGDLVEVVPAR